MLVHILLSILQFPKDHGLGDVVHRDMEGKVERLKMCQENTLVMCKMTCTQEAVI
jgi:hypothetical protein